jgi:hypothetical protein
MAEEKEKAIDKDKKNITPAGAKEDELSDQDVEKVAGGMRDNTDSTNTCKQCVTVC